MNIKNYFLKDVSLKIFSLILAIAVWAMITGKARSNIEKFVNIDVEFVNVLKNVNIYSNPDKVRIKLRGTANDIKLISENDFAVEIDLANVRDGVRNYYTRDFLKTDKTSYIESVHPTMIEVNVREIIRKTIPLKLKFVKTVNGKKKFYRQGRLGEIGYSYQLTPERVVVEGYKSVINNLSHIPAGDTVSLDFEKDIAKKLIIKKPNEVLKILGSKEVELIVRKINTKKIVENNRNGQKRGKTK